MKYYRELVEDLELIQLEESVGWDDIITTFIEELDVKGKEKVLLMFAFVAATQLIPVIGNWLLNNFLPIVKRLYNRMVTGKKVAPREIRKLLDKVSEELYDVDDPEFTDYIDNIVRKYSNRLDTSEYHHELFIQMRKDILTHLDMIGSIKRRQKFNTAY